jgi:hypothetical protein
MVILFDQYNLPKNVYEVIFATEQQIIVGKMLIDMMKEQGGEIGKTEMSLFANKLHEGKLLDEKEQKGPIKRQQEAFSYNKRQFYDRILTPMKGMGMIDYDMYRKKYRISEGLNKALIRIGLMWLQEVQKPKEPMMR